MSSLSATAQELLTPLQYRPVVNPQAYNPAIPQSNTNTLTQSHTNAIKQSTSLRLPFFDDFSNYQGLPDVARWCPSGANVNRDFDALPPTLGMVTFDALDAEGRLYPQATTSLFPADTLQSLALRLDSIWDANPHPARLSDSICLSFYYLPGGGENPEWQHVGSRPGTHDSLILEFWNATSATWQRVWATGGISVDSLRAATGHRWQRVAVMVDSVGYLSPTFSFRFRNLCSLGNNPQYGILGNAAQWLVDYVWIDAHRSRSDSTMHDVAFVSAPPSMLKDYEAMPARQYTAAALADSLHVVITNRYSSTIATRYQYAVYDDAGAELYAYDGGFANVVPFLPGEVYQTAPAHAAPPVNYSFPVGSQPATYYIRHTVREGVGGDERSENDTMTFIQRFADHYAYDDGMPEKGYGVVSTNNPRIAAKFPLTVADTLTVVSLFINDTYNQENATIQFRIAVWADAGGVPGTALYCDENMRHADMEQLGRYQRFVLEHPIVVSGTIYVGLVQQTEGYLNLGFDCNHDHRDRCFYSIGNVWQTTVYRGSLMLRPYFGSGAVVGIGPEAELEPVALTLWPNPVTDRLQVRWSGSEMQGGMLQVYDMMGRCLATQAVDASEATTFHTAAWSKGVYLLVLRNRDGRPLTQKRFVVTGD